MAPRGPSVHEEASIPVEANVWVHYDLQGPQTAPLVVLLPPLGGSGALFEPFRSDLARDHRVLTCEPPGSGESSPPRGLPSTRALARDVIAVLEFLGAEPAHLFGISLGGMVAQWVAIEAPQRVERLILASTTCRPVTPGEALTADNLAFARCLLLSEPGLRMAEQVVSDEVLADADEHARIERAVRAHPHGRAELVWLAAAGGRHDTRDRLPALAHPTLVISGADDTLITPSVQAELVAAIPGARHRTLEGAGHDVTIERPAETAELVRAFIARGG